MLAIDLSAVGVGSLQSLADDRVELHRDRCYWFEEHGDVVVGCDGVGYDVFEAFDGVFGLAGSLHEVGTHAAGEG